MMCKYCEGEREAISDVSGMLLNYKIKISENNIIYLESKDIKAYTKIYYCPMCGRNLETCEIASETEHLKRLEECTKKVSINYEKEYNDLMGKYDLLNIENEEYRRALLNLALKMGECE